MDVPLSSDALDLSFHPSAGQNLLATALISGKVQLLNYDALVASTSESSAAGASSDETPAKLYQKLWVARPSAKPCRGLHFSEGGDSIYTISKDKSVFALNTETGQQRAHWAGAHDAAPSRVLPIDAHLFATGDDDGVVKLWDDRKGPVRAYEHHFDWITDLLWCQHLEQPQQPKKQEEDSKKKRKKQRDEQPERQEKAAQPQTGRSRLVCTSGDGSLSVIDIRMGGKQAAEVSEDQEDELLSVTAVKNAGKLVVGTQLGMLSLWAPARGLLDHVDRIPGHPSSVDALVTLDEDTVLTGSSDGLVRVVQILPHKLLGVIADHGGLPVERMKKKDRWVASLGHGNEVKITDVGPLLEGDQSGDEDEDEDDDEEVLPFGVVPQGADSEEDDSDDDDEEGEEGVQEDEDEDDDNSDDDDSDSSEDAPKSKHPKFNLAPKGGAAEASRKRSQFFSDM